ncbi:MAG TPA: hypothetical protein K8V00_06570 [Ligilactobacillus acidipiscis]|uniref:Uncharacterized protein n=1 Tax=Ligilactobacillus acidipiscis TaxID=89059 RepID=A0A921K0S4_9LACO|nr:hypothetical protein [Ligilactobacillus acidipiscis]
MSENKKVIIPDASNIKLLNVYNYFQSFHDDPNNRIPEYVNNELINQKTGKPTDKLNCCAEKIIGACVTALGENTPKDLDINAIHHGDIKKNAKKEKIHVKIPVLGDFGNRQWEHLNITKYIAELNIGEDDDGNLGSKLIKNAALDFILFYCAMIINKDSDNGYFMSFDRYGDTMYNQKVEITFGFE